MSYFVVDIDGWTTSGCVIGLSAGDDEDWSPEDEARECDESEESSVHYSNHETPI